MTAAPDTLRISQVGLRGVVGAGLTAAHVIDFASAFGTFLEAPGVVVIGRDPRASGEMMRQGVIAGLLACGLDVVDLGIVSTPVLQQAIRRMDAKGGISIGASHNSANWNALKFLGARGSYLSTAQAGELLDIYHLKRFSLVDWRGVGHLRQEAGAVDAYIDELAAAFDFDAIKPFRIVVDCCNGTSSVVLRRLNDRHGFHFVLINEKLQGRAFAHEPAISVDTIGLQLAPLIRPLDAHAGFLFDVDSDRVGIATDEGRAVSEELIMPLVADYLLPKGPGKLVITNLSSTALIEEVAARHGGRVVRVPVGRQAAIDALASYRPEQIALAGEGTGAVMMPRFQFVYDGIAAMLAVLSLMREKDRKLSEIVADYPEYCLMKAQVPLTSSGIPALLMELQQQYSDGQITITDGLRVAWPDRWFHVRVSQTEPIVRVICEKRGGSPAEMFESLLEKVRSVA